MTTDPETSSKPRKRWLFVLALLFTVMVVAVWLSPRYQRIQYRREDGMAMLNEWVEKSDRIPNLQTILRLTKVGKPGTPVEFVHESTSNGKKPLPYAIMIVGARPPRWPTWFQKLIEKFGAAHKEGGYRIRAVNYGGTDATYRYDSPSEGGSGFTTITTTRRTNEVKAIMKSLDNLPSNGAITAHRSFIVLQGPQGVRVVTQETLPPELRNEVDLIVNAPANKPLPVGDPNIYNF